MDKVLQQFTVRWHLRRRAVVAECVINRSVNKEGTRPSGGIRIVTQTKNKNGYGSFLQLLITQQISLVKMDGGFEKERCVIRLKALLLTTFYTQAEKDGGIKKWTVRTLDKNNGLYIHSGERMAAKMVSTDGGYRIYKLPGERRWFLTWFGGHWIATFSYPSGEKRTATSKNDRYGTGSEILDFNS